MNANGLRWVSVLVIAIASSSAACAPPAPSEAKRHRAASNGRPTGPKIPSGGSAPRTGGGGGRSGGTPCLRAPCEPDLLNKNETGGSGDAPAANDNTDTSGGGTGDDRHPSSGSGDNPYPTDNPGDGSGSQDDREFEDYDSADGDSYE
jgi:hypothetical protein